ncbi:hypothetical protein [Kitasatospora sp. MBT66]|uniref:hypothetical protein n=1 Tax=Kitasatospora sp. MBT66 TaxID=1444769 RepID=UPI0005BC2E16|nr:hypothetical protein [Kitasatospora sp. MBT66]
MRSRTPARARGLGPLAAANLAEVPEPGGRLSPAVSGTVSEQRAALASYQAAVADLREELDGVDAEVLRGEAVEGRSHGDEGLAQSVDRTVKRYLELAADWDARFRELGRHLVWLCPGGLPKRLAEFGQAEARALQEAVTGVLRAVAVLHHGESGPDVDRTGWWLPGRDVPQVPSGGRVLNLPGGERAG